MNRNDEYNELLKELDNTPIQLEYFYQRAKAKMKQSRRRKLFTIPFSSLVLTIVLFIISINCFPTFAYACSKIPLIKELAELVNFSSSLTAAIENDYVQLIEQEQRNNGITARVEYLIVDQKQLNVFYSLDSEEYLAMEARVEFRGEDGNHVQAAISNSYFGEKNGELRYVTVDFIEKDMPSTMTFTLFVREHSDLSMTETISSKDLEAIHENDEDFHPKKLEYISEFTFLLEFDPYYTAQGFTMDIKKNILIDGQSLIIEKAEIYPTHMRIELSDVSENTAWLKDIFFYLENEKGEKFDAVSNGITATGDPNSPMMKSHRLESTFFSQSKELYLYITGVKWLDKDMEKIELDLLNVSANKLPEGVLFENAERIDEDWMLTFSGKRSKEMASHQIFYSTYFDPIGNMHEINRWTTDINYGDPSKNPASDRFLTQMPLKDYPFDIVYMKPVFSSTKELMEPIVVKIK